MKIGIDAKRAFHNSTGLGVFNRELINLLATHYPTNEYYLFNPKPGKLYAPQFSNTKEIQPVKVFHKILKSIWRSKWVVNDLKKLGIQLYHGTSQEIPIGIKAAGIPSVVTIHDLFPELYPKDFKPIDVKIYRRKLKYACKNANRIMAISQETKKHIVNYYQINPSKIRVAYQSCNPAFSVLQTEEMKKEVQKNYDLPNQFFLHVGTIIERKNLMNICRAMKLIEKDINIPLVVVGNGGAYKEKVKQFVAENGLERRIIFLSESLVAKGRKPYVATEDFPALYQLATAMIYPSFYEGFGIPIIEAMSGAVPVITSNTSCMPEIGGDAAYYVNPNSAEEMAEGFKKFYGDESFRQEKIKAGLLNSKRFLPQVYISSVMDIYKEAMNS